MSLRNATLLGFILFFFLIIFNISAQNNQLEKIKYLQKIELSIYTPESERRNLDQTLLTYPEWLLVYSPEEFADLTRQNTADEFPFYKEIWQYWNSYQLVTGYAKQISNMNNLEYQIMLWVIGGSTSVEYLLRGLYENSIGRITAHLAGYSEEDHYANIEAQKYADFINIYPWYEFDFYGSLKGLWRLPFFGNNFIRKIERRYNLTTEYTVKLVYAKLIGRMTHSTYGVEKPYTVAAIDKIPAETESMPELKITKQYNNHVYLVKLPRYDAFKNYAQNLARQNINFIEIAGNRSFIGLTIIAKDEPFNCSKNCQILFKQPIYTKPGQEKFFIITPVNELSRLLSEISKSNYKLEHIYDY